MGDKAPTTPTITVPYPHGNGTQTPRQRYPRRPGKPRLGVALTPVCKIHPGFSKNLHHARRSPRLRRGLALPVGHGPTVEHQGKCGWPSDRLRRPLRPSRTQLAPGAAGSHLQRRYGCYRPSEATSPQPLPILGVQPGRRPRSEFQRLDFPPLKCQRTQYKSGTCARQNHENRAFYVPV